MRPAQVLFVNEYIINFQLPTAYQLNQGDIGIVWRAGVRMAVVRITNIHSNTLETEIFTGSDQGALKVGDKVLFEVRLPTKRKETDALPPLEPVMESPAVIPAVESASKAPSTLKSEIGTASEEKFTPLLAPVPMQKKVISSRPSNITHGRVRARQIYQKINTTAVRYDTSRLDTDGGVERIAGGPWSFLWSGNASYRTGNTFSTSPDYRRVEPHIFQTMLSRRGNKGGFARLGRILPYELSGLGYVDGLQLETHASDIFRFGLIGGAKPNRTDLSFSGDEVLGGGYATAEAGQQRHVYYSGTLGFFHTTFKGNPDELAMLYDQRVDLGPKFNFYSNTQIDFDAGAARVHSGARMTRMDFYGNAPLLPYFTARAGFSHYERPDIAAERHLSGEDNLSSFDNGTWRYFVNFTESIPWNFQLDQEVTILKSPDNTSQTLWRGGITHRGFFFMPDALISFSGYNLNIAEGDGYGVLFNGSFPFLSNRLNINVTSGAKYSGKIDEPKRTTLSDFSTQVYWRMTKSWDISLVFSKSYQDYIQSTVVDMSLGYRW